ncbi:O-antigen ligase like membrane protein [Gordonia sp. v-85]|nr:O-antigen ligase like membrane protein [Gordonia sp. v-85]
MSAPPSHTSGDTGTVDPSRLKDNQLQAVAEAGVVSPWTHCIAVLIALMPLLSGTERGLVVPGLKLSEIVALLLILGFVVAGAKVNSAGPLAIGILGYILALFVATAYHQFLDPTLGNLSFASVCFGPLALLAIYFGASYGRALPGLPRLAIRYVLIGCALMGLLGLLQALRVAPVLSMTAALTGSERILQPLDWKISRSIGLFNSWHAFASIMALALVLLVVGWARGQSVFDHKFTQLFCAVGIVAGLGSALTFDMVLVAAAASLIAVGIRRSTRVAAWALLVAVAVTAFTPLGDLFSRRLEEQQSATYQDSILPQTIAFRIEVWREDYLPLFLDNVLLGHGPIRSTDRVFAYVESQYISVLVAGGLLAFVGFIAMYASLMYQLRFGRSRRAGAPDSQFDASRRAAFVFAAVMVVAMLIHPYMRDAGSSQLLVVVAALIGSGPLVTLRGPNQASGRHP